MTTHQQSLAEAASSLRDAERQADELVAGPRQAFYAAVKAAHDDGVPKAEILRASEDVRSRTWIDEFLGRKSRPTTPATTPWRGDVSER